MAKFSARYHASSCADNLWLAVAHSEHPLVDLHDRVREYVLDRYQGLEKRTSALYVVYDTELHAFLPDRSQAHLQLEERLLGRTGVYGPLARFADGFGRLFLDLQSSSSSIHRARKQTTPDGASGWVRVEGEGRFNLQDVIDSASQDAFVGLSERIAERDAVELFYVCLSPKYWPSLARHGGTGMLEPYPSNSTVRSRVHSRNLAVVKSCDASYATYLRTYVSGVEHIDPSAADAENRLRKMGPPEPPFRYPAPVGANEGELAELASAAATSSLEAWEAIGAKLDAIYGRERGQVAWLGASVVFDLGESLTFANGKFGATGEVSIGFEASTNGEIKVAEVARELTLKLVGQNIVLDPDSGTISNASMIGEVPKDEETGFGGASLSVKIDGDQINTSVTAEVGPYGITMDSKGGVRIKTAICDVSGNVHEGTVEISGSYGLKSAIKGLVAKAHGGELPPWFERMPDVKLTWKTGANVGNDASRIMRVIGNYPGFWQLRPRSEFEKLYWNSLDPDEQECLAILGFDPARWDAMELPEGCLDSWWKLSAAQKDASMRIPVATGDPYWVKFWKTMKTNRRPRSTTTAESAGNVGASPAE